MPERFPRRSGPGFTLIEMVVVIAVIGLLTLMVLGAVSSARESARRLTCVQNLHELGLALSNYHSCYNSLPSAFATAVEDRTLETGKCWGWGAMILGFAEQVPQYNSMNFSRLISDPDSRTARSASIGVFLCPSSNTDRSITVMNDLTQFPLVSDLSAANYVASAGTRNAMRSPRDVSGSILSRNGNFDGAMYRNSNVGLPGVTDGASSTFMAGERAQELADATWVGTFPSGMGYVCTQPGRLTQECVFTNVLVLGHTGYQYGLGVVDTPNYPRAGADGFWSMHPGGCNFLFCDGGVRFVCQTVSPAIYQALSTRAGGEVLGDY